MNKQELEEYFKSDKTVWIIKSNKEYPVSWKVKFDSDDKQIWEEEKVKEFWHLIRVHKIEKNDFNFSSYIFPKLETDYDESFFSDRKNKEFLKKVNFDFATFTGETLFNNYIFSGGASFEAAIFNNKVSFTGCHFFKEEVNFSRVKFKGASNFNDLVFKEGASFVVSDFQKRVSFEDIKYLGESHYDFAKFNGMVIFGEGSTDFTENNRKTSMLSFIRFNSYVDFSRIIFRDDQKFTKLNLRKAVFNPLQTLGAMKFIDCSFGGNHRIILKEERHLPNQNIFFEFNSERFTKNNNNGAEYFSNRAYLYRGLKKNFEENRDWDLSGKAFRSEMEMTKWFTLYKIFRIKCNSLIDVLKAPFLAFVFLIEFIVYFIYGFFSGYTQSFIKPFVFLIISLFVGAYYFHINIIDESLSHSFFRSITYSIPYVDLINNPLGEESLEWIKIIGFLQRILGVVFIAFMIFALRKRFKQ